MSARKVCLAVDLGASGGRVMAGIYHEGTLELREVNRFPNTPVKDAGGWHWALDELFGHIKAGIARALAEYGGEAVSLGVDAWGVDYGLLDANGKLLGAPFQYRDSRTDGMMDEACRRMPKAEIYRRTGIQFMFFNTLFQLLAEQKSSARLLEKADRLLFVPDLINYFLTGRKVNEHSIASTGQLLDPRTGDWDRELLTKLGLPEKIFDEMIFAGTALGGLLPEIQRETGATKLQVIAVGSHDTASAVAGVPSCEPEPVFLSSGTWSLMGRELKAPLVTEAGFEAGFSNEGGVCGTTRLLKNIAGMWLLQECKRAWDGAGQVYEYSELVELAGKAEPFATLIDPNAPEFNAPENMVVAIESHCREKGRPVPVLPAQVTRAILEGLAWKYRATKESLELVTHKPVDKIYIVGGGSQNRLLNQLAADATGCTVIAGPVEAASVGNILMQLMALGEIGSLEAGRALVRRSFATETYEPDEVRSAEFGVRNKESANKR